MSFLGARVEINSTRTGLTWPLIISWDKLIYDTSGFYSSGTDKRFTIPAGIKKIRISAGIEFGSLAVAGSTLVRINKNTETASAAITVPQLSTSARNNITGSSDNSNFAISAVVDVQEGDYFVVNCNVSMSGQTSILASPFTFFEIEVKETG